MRNSINVTECATWLENINFSDTNLILSMAILAIVNVMVIVGNCLVIAAVYCSVKLRSVTNLFIVSLAIADLLVGLAVLPFSATWEVFKVWMFGDIWCQVWLALDVWTCTASILNLCIISFDRYIAVTRPLMYPNIMSHFRAKMLIAGIWILSFAICFPPLVGWRDTKNTENYELLEYHGDCPWTCELTSETGYVVYSALGSFYIPMFVMIFFYWRIYRAAVGTTRAIKRGFRTAKGSKGFGSRFDEQRLTLRIHRGRGSLGNRSYLPSNGSNNTLVSSRNKHHIRTYKSNRQLSSEDFSLVNDSSSASESVDILSYSDISPSRQSHMKMLPPMGRSISQSSRHSKSCELISTSSCSLEGNKSRISASRTRQRIRKAQVKRFQMETKAAKTLGIIVGGFIFCWFPFFTVYLVRAFCRNCIHPLVFSILFWMGYCNSAVNPLIYAMFSKDYRFAFKKIIFKCVRERRNKEGTLTSRLRKSKLSGGYGKTLDEESIIDNLSNSR